MSDECAVRLIVSRHAYDAAVDALWMLGPTAVAEGATPAGEIELIAGFVDGRTARDAAAALAGHGAQVLPAGGPDWVETWRAHEPSYIVGPLGVRLPEHAPTGAHIDIVIEPRASFGFSHVSTRLALELMATQVRRGLLVADVGCGTGVLGIAAALLGAGAVSLVDTDADAIEATVANVERNAADVASPVLGSVMRLPLVAYDLMAVNVTAATLVELAPDITNRCADGGIIVASGMLTAQRETVVAAFAPWTVTAECGEGEWLAVALSRSGPSLA